MKTTILSLAVLAMAMLAVTVEPVTAVCCPMEFGSCFTILFADRSAMCVCVCSGWLGNLAHALSRLWALPARAN